MRQSESCCSPRQATHASHITAAFALVTRHCTAPVRLSLCSLTNSPLLKYSTLTCSQPKPSANLLKTILQECTNREHSLGVSEAANDGTESNDWPAPAGSGVLWLPGVPLLWLATQQSPTTRLFWANCFLLLWVDIALVGALKGLFRRKRPIYNHAGDFVVVVAVDQYSFPSGHAARSVSDLFAAAVHQIKWRSIDSSAVMYRLWR